ncbi:MAG: phosphatidate cytidylyltransferase [Parafilimonas sp.]|nr:phosphatidate cytidylyltransferase [Parafilimonas sp.]
MALNLQAFKTRTLTSVVFVIIMLCGLLIDQWSFLILFSIIHFGCWIEYQKLARKIFTVYKSVSLLHIISAMLAGWGFIFWMTNNAYIIDDFKLSMAGLYLMIISVFVLLITQIISSKRYNLKALLISIFGLLYIPFSCGCMMQLRSEGMIFGNFFGIDLGLILPLFIIITIWINDTMAYLVGSLIGKTQLSSVSPKKTWEGTIGGVLLAVITVTFCGYFLINADVLQLIIISVITCVAGIYGDLFESKLKRLANVKDSGNIMPGHGGFLDRFDSLLFATILVWLYLKLFL